MKRCKVCGKALSGLRGKMRKIFFNQYPSDKDQDICNKCVGNIAPDQSNKRIDKLPTSEDEKYQCPVCKRMIHQSHALEHIKTEEYLMKLISKDHPRWGKEEPICKECIDYYRKLVDDAEI
ncbi:MAG: hypothetical protein K9L84_01030 [Candidatus Omnitrophica bacterium]|nr:hypothetical protein [Candidatus Omnitrophota bacterium]